MKNNTFLQFLFIFFFQGLRETFHPYFFVARQGFAELLAVNNGGAKAVPILTKLAPPLKLALVSN